MSQLAHSFAIAIVAIALAGIQVASADTSASASSRIGITKLPTVNLRASKSNLLMINTLESTAGNQESHVCLSSSPHAPPYALEIVQNPGAKLTAASNETGIVYSASVSRYRQTNPSSNCGSLESELTINIAEQDAKQADPGFYSANLILMVVVE